MRHLPKSVILNLIWFFKLMAGENDGNFGSSRKWTAHKGRTRQFKRLKVGGHVLNWLKRQKMTVCESERSLNQKVGSQKD